MMKKKQFNYNRINRVIHYWCAIICAIPVLIVISTGILLMFKKNINWIQPQTLQGQNDIPIISFDQILIIAKNIPQAEIKTWKDIKRLDVRPSKGITKIRAKNNWEIQIDNTTGKLLGTAFRRSDIIEAIHTGAFFTDWTQYWVFFPSALILLILWVTGIYLFFITELAKVKKRKKHKKKPYISTLLPFMAPFLFFIYHTEPSSAFDGIENKIIFKQALNKSWKLNHQINVRINHAGLFYQYYQIGAEYLIAHSWTLSSQYRLIYKRKQDDYWQFEHRPFIELQTKRILSPSLRMALKYRHEYRILETGKNQHRGRFSIKLVSRKKILNKAISPYLNEEIFYDYHLSEFIKNQFSIGIQIAKKTITPDLAFKILFDKKNSQPWKMTGFLVFSLRF